MSVRNYVILWNGARQSGAGPTSGGGNQLLLTGQHSLAGPEHTGVFATPVITLGTAAASGSALTTVRSDSTIVAFDATVPVAQAFGDAAATGSAAVAARRDHKHAMPADPAGASGTPTFAGYTPALTAVTTNPTLGSGSFAGGRYAQIGKVVIGNAFIGFGSSGVGAGSGEYRISLPVAGNFTGWLLIGNGYVFDSSASVFRAVSIEPLTGTTARLAVDNGIYIAHNGPWPWAASDQLRIHFSYEAA